MNLKNEVMDWDGERWQRRVYVLFLESEMEPLAKGKAEIQDNVQKHYVRIGEFEVDPHNNMITSPPNYLGCKARVCRYGSFSRLQQDEVDRRLRDRAVSALISLHQNEAADLLGLPHGRPVWMLVRNYRHESSGDQEAFFDLMNEHAAKTAKQAMSAAIRRANACRERARSAANRDTQRSSMNQLFGKQTSAAHGGV